MMKKSFSARRVPRQIGRDEDEESVTAQDSHSAPQSDSTVKRPVFKSRKTSSLRQYHAPASLNNDEDEESDATVVIPKRTNLSRIAIQRNATKRPGLVLSQLPSRHTDDEEGAGDGSPSYSADSLQALKDSTPSTPQDLSLVERSTDKLSLASKYGSSLAQSTAIPSAAEIAEKKARRARLAKEQQAEEYISLDPDDPILDNEGAGSDEDENVTRDEHGRLILKPRDRYGRGESRLMRDDEDFMESFDDFVEDGGITLGHRAEVEAATNRRQEMAAQIAEAEAAGASDDSEDSNSSERERNAHFEAAQTRHGTYAQHTTANAAAARARDAAARPKTPPIITPLPTLDGALDRLRKQLQDMQTTRARQIKEMEAMQQEKVRLAEEEVRIQQALKETAEKFAALRREKGVVIADNETGALQVLSRGNGLPAAYAGGPVLTTVDERDKILDDADAAESSDNENAAESSDDESAVNEKDPAHVAAGFDSMGSMSGTRRGFGGGLGFAGEGEENEDDYY